MPYRRSFRVTQADNDLAGWDAGKEEITLWTLTIVECDEPQDFGQKWREIAEKHSWGSLSPTTWDAVKNPPIVF